MRSCIGEDRTRVWPSELGQPALVVPSTRSTPPGQNVNDQVDISAFRGSRPSDFVEILTCQVMTQAIGGTGAETAGEEAVLRSLLVPPFRPDRDGRLLTARSHGWQEGIQDLCRHRCDIHVRLGLSGQTPGDIAIFTTFNDKAGMLAERSSTAAWIRDRVVRLAHATGRS